MKKLLNKSIRPLIVYALVLLTLSVPVYFYIINKIWINELDDRHVELKTNVEKQLNKFRNDPSKLAETIQLWNQIEGSIQIKPAMVTQVEPDRFYTINRLDSADNDEEQLRGLKAYIYVNQQPYQLTAETDMEEMNETVLTIAAVALVFFLLLLMGFIFLNRFLSARIWKPFYRTMDQLQSFDLKSNTGIELGKSNIREFEELNQTLNQLIAANISAYQQQKEFTENASHELQTPLAIIKSKLDVLLQDSTLSPEQATMIESINTPLSRVSRINKNLLLLAKIENQQFDENEMVDVSELVNHDIEMLAEHIENKNIQIKKNIQPDVTLLCNKSLFEILLTNLLLNAIRHSPENGQMGVELTGRGLIFSNTGASSLNTGALFQRFISSSTQSPSSGLGLAIAYQICTRFGWEINYRFNQGLHIFSIEF